MGEVNAFLHRHECDTRKWLPLSAVCRSHISRDENIRMTWDRKVRTYDDTTRPIERHTQSAADICGSHTCGPQHCRCEQALLADRYTLRINVRHERAGEDLHPERFEIARRTL